MLPTTMRQKIISIIIFVVVVGVVVFALISEQRRFTVNLNLSPEERESYQQSLVQWDQRIRDVPEGEKPSPDLYFEKARYQEYLGQYGSAIKTLLTVFKYYENSSIAWNNLSKLYEKVGEYNKANYYYMKNIDVFDLKQYYLNVAFNFYRMKKFDKAQSAYELYKKETGNRDEEIEYYLSREL